MATISPIRLRVRLVQVPDNRPSRTNTRSLGASIPSQADSAAFPKTHVCWRSYRMLGLLPRSLAQPEQQVDTCGRSEAYNSLPRSAMIDIKRRERAGALANAEPLDAAGDRGLARSQITSGRNRRPLTNTCGKDGARSRLRGGLCDRGRPSSPVGTLNPAAVVLTVAITSWVPSLRSGRRSATTTAIGTLFCGRTSPSPIAPENGI